MTYEIDCPADERRILVLDLAFRRPDGHITAVVETHRTHVRDEDGSILVGFSDEFPYIRADEIAQENGWDVEDVQAVTYTQEAYDAELASLDADLY